MLEMRAIVVQVLGEEASVQPLGNGGCGHCDTAGGCGSGNLTKLFCSNKPRHFVVRNQARAKVGDEVRVSLPDGVLLRGATKMYLFPLALLFAGGIFGASLASDALARDIYAAAGAAVGLLLGFVVARLAPGSGQAVATSIVTTQTGS